MDHLHLMQTFVAVAEEEGFAAAARRLQMSPPAVTRAVAALERRLGVSLLIRSTRHVRVTAAGRRYLDDARRILAEVEQANEAVIGIHTTPRGRLTVTAPVLFGQQYVMPGIVEYLLRYPEVQVEAVFLDRVVNLLEEGFDAGIRIGKLPDSGQHAIPVARVRQMLVAGPGYLAAHGMPANPNALQAHTLIASRAGDIGHDWHFQGQDGPYSVRLTPRLSVTTMQGAINAACQNLGITRVISYQIADQLETGSLRTVLGEYEPAPLPIHIVYREGRLASARVRCFIDLMTDRLRADAGLNAIEPA